MRPIRSTALGAVATLAAVAAVAAAPCPLAGQAFAGDGMGATPIFVLTSGTTPVSVESTDRSFAALLIGTDGVVVAELSAAARQEVRVPRDGRYLFEVRAAGPWRISLAPADSTRVLEATGRIDGAAAAAGSSAGWLGRGFGAGLILGPIGTLIVVQRAAQSDVAPGPDVRQRLDGRHPAYADAFHEAFTSRQRGDRRSAALVGGLTGTAILAFAILQLTVWGDGGDASGDPPDPGGTTDILLPPLLRLGY